jgi:hypothetical protein
VFYGAVRSGLKTHIKLTLRASQKDDLVLTVTGCPPFPARRRSSNLFPID